MTGVTFHFDDGRPPVWREIPTVPRAGEQVIYDGVPYLIKEVTWYGTDHTWAASIKCAGEKNEFGQPRCDKCPGFRCSGYCPCCDKCDHDHP